MLLEEHLAVYRAFDIVALLTFFTEYTNIKDRDLLCLATFLFERRCLIQSILPLRHRRRFWWNLPSAFGLASQRNEARSSLF